MRLIEPFISGVECRDGDEVDFKVADGSMSTAWFDHECAAGADGYFFTVEFHMAFAFDNVVDFGDFFVVVEVSIVEEELGDDCICTSVDLTFEVIEVSEFATVSVCPSG